jgi:hypothetical protein
MLSISQICKSLAFAAGLFAFSATAQSIRYTAVDEAKLWERLGRVPLKNADRMARAKEMFEELGCANVLLPVKGSKLPNVECRLPGESADEIVIGAHFDKVPPGEGAVDNWTGVSMLAHLYESYRRQPLKHTLVFVAFTDEEVGLVGSRAYVKSRQKTDLDRVKAYVNLDSLALGPLEVWQSRASPQLIQMASNTAKAINMQLYSMNVDGVGDGDSHPFLDKKIPVVDFHSLTGENWKILHSPNDTLAAVSRGDYVLAYRFLAVFVGVLDARLESLADQATRPK